MTGELDLSHNLLTGVIPYQIGDLIYLEHLDLSGNQFSGAIPSEIRKFTPSLRWLFLNDNQLAGIIPEDICDIPNIWFSANDFEFFNISRNKLCPPYPTCFEGYHTDQDSSDCF